MINHAGRMIVTAPRLVTSSDSGYPEDTSTSSALSGSIEIPEEARGAITHCLVDLSGNSSSVNVNVQIYGWLNSTLISIHNDSTKGQIGRWYFLGALNNNSAISTAGVGGLLVDSSNRLSYAESILHASAYLRLFARVTNLSSGASVEVTFIFET